MCHQCPISTVAAAKVPRRRPAWSRWAPQLARELRKSWPWLATGPAPQVAAALGARLGPDWTGAMLVDWVRRRRARPLLDAPDKPVGYLVMVIEESLTGLEEPPAPARLHDERRRQLVADERAELQAAAAEWRAQLDERDAAAAARRERLSGTDPVP